MLLLCKNKFWLDFPSVYSFEWLACFPVSKHSFALQLWTRALLRVVLKGDRPSTNPARR